LTVGLAVLVGLFPLAAQARPAPHDDPAADAPVAVLLADPAALADWLRAHHPKVRAAAARVDQAGAEARQSGVLPNPSLALSLSNIALGRTTPPGLGFNDTAIWSAQLAETVELGKRGPRMASARLRLEAARERFRDDLASAMGEARAALARVAWLRARQAVLDESLAQARQILELERSRRDHGDLSGNDWDRLALDTLTLQTDVAQNRVELDAATSACRAALAAPCPVGPLDLAGLRGAAQAPADVGDPGPWLERRPDLRALALERGSARQDEVLARRRVIPDPTVAVTYTHDRFTVSGDNANVLSFSVSFPLPAFDRGQHDAARAAGRAGELELSAEAIREEAAAEVRALLQRRAFVEQALADVGGLALPASKSVLDSTVTAFDRGQISMTDLLLARRTHTALLLKAIDLEFEAFSVRNDLRQALGLDAEAAGKPVE
jgi:cobalt-zinc-cadmium efflux system outer membrane protein